MAISRIRVGRHPEKDRAKEQLHSCEPKGKSQSKRSMMSPKIIPYCVFDWEFDFD